MEKLQNARAARRAAAGPAASQRRCASIPVFRTARVHTARVIQMISATISRIPTIVQIRPLFMGLTNRLELFDHRHRHPSTHRTRRNHRTGTSPLASPSCTADASLNPPLRSRLATSFHPGRGRHTIRPLRHGDRRQTLIPSTGWPRVRATEMCPCGLLPARARMDSAVVRASGVSVSTRYATRRTAHDASAPRQPPSCFRPYTCDERIIERPTAGAVCQRTPVHLADELEEWWLFQ